MKQARREVCNGHYLRLNGIYFMYHRVVVHIFSKQTASHILIINTLLMVFKFSGTNIQVFSLHPGSVQSNLARHVVRKEWLPNGRLSSFLLKTTVEGIQTTLYCALEAQQQEPYYYR